MGGRNTDEIEVSEMIVLVHNMPKERQDFFFQSVARVGQTTGVRSYALDPAHAEALWSKSEEMVAEKFSFD